MDKVINNVFELCKDYPDDTRTYQQLVLSYWFKYDFGVFFLHHFDKLTSPESICRAYRTLVARGDIQ